MATYIDKINYNNNTYNLIDSGATHDSQGILIGTTGDFKVDKELYATRGIFNYLEAIDGKIENLTTEDLSTTNATVVGLLDVQGQMHTNSWTNANIATIGGSFYIAPTIETPGTIQITYTPSEEGSSTIPSYSISVSGAALPSDQNNVVTGGVVWKTGSKVMITGSIIIAINEVETTYPLGTCIGTLSGMQYNSSSSSWSFTVNNIYGSSDVTSDDSIFAGSLKTLIEDLNSNTITGTGNIKISMYEIYDSNTYKPVGIMMTSYGYDKATYIDIYGGTNARTGDNNLANPNVRIGYLGDGQNSYGLSTIGGSLPQGWGIYTDNGYFKGTIVASSGTIGEGDSAWKIGNAEDRAFIYSGVSDINSTTITGMYVGTDGILNVQENADPNESVPYTQITNGILTARGANLHNLTIFDEEGNKRAGVDTTGFNIYDGESATTNNALIHVGHTYIKTNDREAINSEKKYYTKDGNVYTEVADPVVSELPNYYEDSNVVQVGTNSQFHITMTSQELGFYQNDETKVAYIQGDEMFIKKTIVANSLDVGLSQNQTDFETGAAGLGQWSWTVHQVDDANNLSLKWID